MALAFSDDLILIHFFYTSYKIVIFLLLSLLQLLVGIL